MAEIPVEKKSSLAWLWILLALLILGLLIWWALDDDEEVEPLAPTGEIVGANTIGADPVTAPEPVAMEGGVTVADLLGNPTQYVGNDNVNLTGVSVPGVPTDRGFWIEDQGQRVFAVIIDNPAEVPKEINPGQQLIVREAMARDATFIEQIPGEPLDNDTLQIMRDQDIYLVVAEEDIEITQAGNPQPGTSRAPTAPPAN